MNVGVLRVGELINLNISPPIAPIAARGLTAATMGLSGLIPAPIGLIPPIVLI